MSKVLLVDAAFSALPLYHSLIAEGHQVITVGNRDRDPLVSISHRHVNADYSDPVTLSTILNEERIDYMVPGCTDASYESCAATNDDKRFSGIDSPEAFATLCDKRLFRIFAEREGLSSPRLANMDAIDSTEPVIVKPVDSYSGRGITVLRTPDVDSVRSAMTYATSVSSCGQALVEEFVDGALYSHSAFLVGGRIAFDFVVREYCVVDPFSVDVSHVSLDLPDSVHAEIQKQIEHLAEALDLCDGLLHTQFIARGTNFWIIEVTRRCPGDLYSMLINYATGTDYSANYTAAFIGSTPKLVQQAPPGWILRQTISCDPDRPFEGFKWPRPIKIRSLVPTALPGSLPDSSPLRVGVAFYDCGSRSGLLETAAYLTDNPPQPDIDT